MSSMWHLAAVARSPALQTFLSADDQQRVDNVLHPTEDAAAPAAAVAELPAAASTEADAAADDDSFPTSAHLERRVSYALWRQWKLADEHIAQLTAPDAAVGEALRALESRVTALSFFSRGKRGVLYAGELQSTGERVVAKLAADVEAQASVTAEARWLREMNRLGLGAKLLDAGPGWFLSERLEGSNAVEFLTQPAPVVSRQDALWLVREMLTQCFTMDLMGVNKAEMTHPHRHIIVHRRADASGWKCSFVDFEKCAYSTKPKNVTQLCQFLSSPRMVALLHTKQVNFDVQQLRKATKLYKQRVGAPAFDAITRVFGV